MAPYVAQFVPVKLDTSSDEYREFRRNHESEGNSIPKVFIVRADGETMFGQSTSLPGAQMAEVLGACLSNCGRVLSEREVVALDEAATEIATLREQGETAEAIKALKRAGKFGTPGQLGSFAQPAIAVDEQALALHEEAMALLEPVALRLGMQPEDEAEETAEAEVVEDEAGRIAALQEFLVIEEQFEGLGSIRDAVRMVTRHISRDDQLKGLSRALKALDRAESARSLSSVERSMNDLIELLEDYPEGAMHEMIMTAGRALNAEKERLEVEQAASGDG
ncbi:MAG: hypothetical protein AAF456_14370 [Planctomycetota bacterium]